MIGDQLEFRGAGSAGAILRIRTISVYLLNPITMRRGGVAFGPFVQHRALYLSSVGRFAASATQRAP
jgi:hypothetical protein